MTAMTEITRNGAKSARGLISIQSRYNQILDDSSSTGKKLSAWYKEHNIKIKDQNGQLRSFFEVGGEVAKQWDKMSDNEKKYYMNIQAGANQSQNLAALMKNYQTALKATASAEGSAGSAAKENARYLDSMEGKMQDLRSAWEKLSYKLIDSEILKKAIEGLTKALDYLSSDSGLKLIHNLELLAGVFAGFKILSGIVGAFDGLATAIGATAGAAVGAEGAVSGLAALFAGGGTAWGLLGPVGVVYGILALNEALKETPQEDYSQTKDELKTLQDEYSQTKDELDKLREKQKKSAESGKDLSDGDKQRLYYLEQQTAELQKQIDKKKELLSDKWEKKEGKKAPSKKESERAGGTIEKGSGNIFRGFSDKDLGKLGLSDDLTNKAEKYKQVIAEIGSEYQKTGHISGSTLDKQKKSIDDVKKEQKSWLDHFGEVAKMPPEFRKVYKESKKLTDAYDYLDELQGQLAGNQWGDLTAGQAERAEVKFKDLGSAIGVTVDESGEIASIDYNKFVGGLDAAGISADQAKGALEQLAETNPDMKVNVDGIEVAVSQIDKVQEFLDKINGEDAEATIEIDGVEYAIEDIGNVENLLRVLGGEPCSVKFDSEGSEEVIKKAEIVDNTVDTIPDEHDTKITTSGTNKSKKQADSVGKSVEGIAKKHNTKITTSGTSNAEEKIKGVRDELRELPDYKSITISIGVSGAKAAADAVSELKGNAQGTRNADAGLSEVNEAGFEFIRDAKTGKLRIAGGGKRTVTKLNEGDIVYTHEESKRMMSDNADIEIPQHKSGSEKKKKYNEAREKVKNKYEKKKEETEHNAKVHHWTDKQLQKQKEKDLKQYKKNVAKENKKWSGVKKNGVEREEIYEVQEGRADVNHDKWTRKIEKAIEKLSQSGERNKKSKEYKNAKKVINQAKDKKHISGDERRDFLDEINEIISSNQTSQADRVIQNALDRYENYGGSKEEVVKLIKKYAKGKNKKITKAERDEYLRQVDEITRSLNSKEKQKEIDTMIEAVSSGGDYSQAVKTIEAAYKDRRITKDEYEDYLKSAAEAQKDYQKHIAERKLSGMMEGLSKGGKLADTEKHIEAMRQQGLITAEEAEDYLKEARETAKEYEHEKATKAIETLMSGVRGTNADFAKIKQQIEAEAKAGHISAEEREQYLKEAYKQNLDYNMKLFASNKKTYADMRKTLEQYYKEGKLTAAEYYEYLDSLMQEQLAQQQKSLEKMQTNNSNAYSLAQAYVNKQIKALQEDNEELDKQNELLELQANLEKAKNQKVKIYREGVGFVYEQNTEAIEEATKALQDFHKEEKSPELQKWEAISDLFGELEEEANMRDLEVRLGTTAQGLVGGLGTDVDKWTAWIKNNLATGLGYTSILEAMGELTTAEDIDKFLSGTNDTLSQSYINSMINKNRFASGTLSARGGLARVAENGYEIALLGKGDAVMPHNVSKNLMEWGQYSPKDFVGSSGDTIQQYSFDKLVLPNVENAHDFIRELQNLPNKALQFGTSRGY